MPSVSVKVLLFATFRKKYGSKELTVESDGTVRGLIESASRILGAEFYNDVYDSKRGIVRDDLIFTVNGRNIKDLKGNIELKDGDVVAIFPPLAGGGERITLGP